MKHYFIFKKIIRKRKGNGCIDIHILFCSFEKEYKTLLVFNPLFRHRCQSRRDHYILTSTIAATKGTRCLCTFLSYNLSEVFQCH